MEEWVGLKWHEYVTRQAMGEFPEHTVHLKDEARTLGVLFRAMGGDPALSLVVAEPRQFQIRRRFLHKLAGTHRKFELAWRDEDSLRLPDRLALFPSRKANRDLYLWLAALASLGRFTTTAGCRATRPWCSDCLVSGRGSNPCINDWFATPCNGGRIRTACPV